MKKAFKKYRYLPALLLAVATYLAILVFIIDRVMVHDSDTVAALHFTYFGLCLVIGSRLYIKDLRSFFTYFGIVWVFVNYWMISSYYDSSTEREMSNVVTMLKIVNAVSLLVGVIGWIRSIVAEVQRQNRRIAMSADQSNRNP